MRVRRLAWPACAAALLTLSASPASAQSSLILPETHVFRAGPTSVYPTLAVRDVGVDSNVYNDSTGPKGDFTYTFAPRLYIVTPMANSRFVGTGFGNLVYFNPYAPDSLSGFTVSQILGVCDAVLAGGPLPSGYTYITLADLLEELSLSFEDCVPSFWSSKYLFIQ